MININKIGQTFFFGLLILSMSLPTAFTTIKLVFLIVLMGLCLILAFKNKKLLIHSDLFLISLFFSSFGLVYSFYGLIFDNPGSIKTLTVMVIYPLLFLLITSFFVRFDDFSKINDIFKYSAISVIIVQVTFLLSASDIISNSIADYFIKIHPGHSVLHMTDEFLLFTLPNVSSLIFLIPFFLAYIMLTQKINYMYILLLLIMLMLVLLTGRRAFFVSFGFSLFFFIIVSMYLKNIFHTNIIKRLINIMVTLIVIFMFVIIYYQMDLTIYIDKFNSIFDFSADDSNLERVYQFRSLVEGISNSPLFGSGAGAATNYSRSSEQPWAYELSYIALIFHYGILGFLFYFFAVLYLIYKMLEICKENHVSNNIKVFIVSFLSGMVGFLIANATNPYLGKFDYMWVIFIPVMIINAYKVEKKERLSEDI